MLTQNTQNLTIYQKYCRKIGHRRMIRNSYPNFFINWLTIFFKSQRFWGDLKEYMPYKYTVKIKTKKDINQIILLESEERAGQHFIGQNVQLSNNGWFANHFWVSCHPKWKWELCRFYCFHTSFIRRKYQFPRDSKRLSVLKSKRNYLDAENYVGSCFQHY